MARGTRFHPHGGALVVWVCAHAIVWTALALVAGVTSFVDSWRVVLAGAAIGGAHAWIQWRTTCVSVADGEVVSRNFGWVRRVPVDEVEVISRIRHKGWSGVALRLRDGEEVMLAAPMSSALAPNPHFDEDLHRLCATIAFDLDE